MTEKLCSISGRGQKISLFSNMSSPALEFNQHPSPCVPQALSQSVKSRPHSVPIRSVWVYTSTLLYTLMVSCLTKCWDNFTFCHYCGWQYVPASLCTDTATFTAVWIYTAGDQWLHWSLFKVSHNFSLMFAFFIHLCKSIISRTLCNTSNHVLPSSGHIQISFSFFWLHATPYIQTTVQDGRQCSNWHYSSLSQVGFHTFWFSVLHLVMCLYSGNDFLQFTDTHHLTNMLLIAHWSSASEIKKVTSQMLSFRSSSEQGLLLYTLSFST